MNFMKSIDQYSGLADLKRTESELFGLKIAERVLVGKDYEKACKPTRSPSKLSGKFSLKNG